MAYQLIPFPLSILFVAVFAVVVLIILWRLGRNGKFFRALFYGASVAAVLFLVGLVLMLALTPAPLPTGPLEIQVATNKTSYVLGQEIPISVCINNTNDWAVSAPSQLILHVSNGHGGAAKYYNLNSNSALPAHSTLQKTISWTPTTSENNKYAFWFTPGNWTIQVLVNISPCYAECNVTLTPAQ